MSIEKLLILHDFEFMLLYIVVDNRNYMSNKKRRVRKMDLLNETKT
jgi:hypothetical protein